MSSEKDAKFDELVGRICKTAGTKRVGIAAAARALGMTRQGLQSHKTRGTLPEKQLFRFVKDANASPKWLLTGEGQYTGECPPVGPEMAPCKDEMVDLDVFALARAGQPRDLVGPEPIKTITPPKEFLKLDIVPVMIQGESMEPNLYDGAVVGVDKNDRQIISGKVYAVWLDYEGAVIKRVFVEPDKIVLKSDNPGFPESRLDIEGIKDGFVLGRVKWVIQKL